MSHTYTNSVTYSVAFVFNAWKCYQLKIQIIDNKMSHNFQNKCIGIFVDFYNIIAFVAIKKMFAVYK